MDIIQRLTSTPLWASAHEIAETALDAVELVPRPDQPPPAEIGASHFGGTPDLAVGVRWPRGNGRPLSLLLQLDLSDLDGVPGMEVLPSSGTLQFFYDVVMQPWGYRQSDRRGWRVLYAPAEAELRRSASPSGLAPELVLPEVALTCQHTVTFPGSHSDLAVFEDDTEDAYRELVLEGDRIRHLLLGHPDPIQRDPVGAGQRSLLQLDSDSLLGTMWGDSGKLHWTIPEPALHACELGATWLELQCC